MLVYSAGVQEACYNIILTYTMQASSENVKRHFRKVYLPRRGPSIRVEVVNVATQSFVHTEKLVPTGPHLFPLARLLLLFIIITGLQVTHPYPLLHQFNFHTHSHHTLSTLSPSYIQTLISLSHLQYLTPTLILTLTIILSLTSTYTHTRVHSNYINTHNHSSCSIFCSSLHLYSLSFSIFFSSFFFSSCIAAPREYLQ